jgi:hypothetical protein
MTAIAALTEQSAQADEEVARSGPIVAYVSDPRRGEISVMDGDREVTVHDRKLAASIVRAAR